MGAFLKLWFLEAQPALIRFCGRFCKSVILTGVLLSGPASPAIARDDVQLPQIGPPGPPGAPAYLFPVPHRPVAPIVSEQWSTEEARDKDGEAEEVMNFLGVKPGTAVADLGAGMGYYTTRLARRVGPEGRVLAEDVIPAYLTKLKKRVDSEGLGNVTLILGEAHDPHLPFRSVDLVLMVHMYHEAAQPYGLLFNILPALRPGARVAVIDLDQPIERHGTPRSLLLCEFQSLGFRQTHWGWLRGKREYLALFEPPAKPPRHDAIVACSP
jgi:SAM-dependent methyltransferase